MRAWHKLTIALVILAGLFVAADRIAVGVADDKVAEKIQSEKGLNTRPKVSIEGFPFLTQVAAKKLDDVRLSADGLQISGGGKTATLQTFSARISGVRVNSSFSSATADSADGTALISYADITSLIGNKDAAISYGGNGKIKISGKVDTPLGQVDGSATARLAVQGGDTVTVGDVSVSALGSGIDLGSIPGLDTAFSSLFATSQKLSGLPVGLSVKSVDPQPNGVAIGFTGHNLDLAG
ncbi:LmeA family phospholipid-binding protein [Peterkaempfera griseoplana]|uniref:LmeA family phospholipid-binding protein n=1 Tax=Peterkaempfera griseoplana TaxID=66896 RepID=UPI0006E262FE|nr:DUF2993 domain-containing protein [Peterkaempfera griseoplana]